MNDNITLPRQTVQQALDALEETTALCINYESVEEKNGYEFTEAKEVIPMGNAAITALRTALEQQSEPVAIVDDEGVIIVCSYKYKPGDKLYTAPPQRKELSESEILNMMPSTIPAEYDGELMEFARAVEAKLKEGT